MPVCSTVTFFLISWVSDINGTVFRTSPSIVRRDGFIKAVQITNSNFWSVKSQRSLCLGLLHVYESPASEVSTQFSRTTISENGSVDLFQSNFGTRRLLNSGFIFLSPCMVAVRMARGSCELWPPVDVGALTCSVTASNVSTEWS